MASVSVETFYSTSSCNEVELPEGKTFDDVRCVSVKWGGITIWFNDGSKYEDDLMIEGGQEDDYKRPNEIKVFETNSFELGDFSQYKKY